jgi:hypothetical protein
VSGRQLGPRLALVAAITVLATHEAAAWTVVYHASTPVSPPAGFTWLPVFAGVALLVLNGALLVGPLRTPWRAAAGRAVGVGAVFGIGFFAFGSIAAAMETVPVPGLGWGHPVQWGLSHLVVTRRIFLGWNVCGGLFLACTVLLVAADHRPFRPRDAALLVAANLAAYGVLLAPYGVTGALTHGSVGDEAAMHCERQLSDLGTAILKYARERGGKLPEARDCGDLFQRVGRHLVEPVNWQGRTACFCIVGSAFDRHPRAYEWNPAVSGLTLEELEELADPLPVLSCPYSAERHPARPLVLYTQDLVDAAAPGGKGHVLLGYSRTLAQRGGR